jgi:5'-nucleotidase
VPDGSRVACHLVRVLLTNDDGIEAPGLIPFARALGESAEVRIVVPDGERSWVGKAITRFDPVSVERRTIEDVEIWACSGYPADCVQLGINTLYPDRPDLVVSGVNIGYNHGLAYLQSSGTAGAALEAGIARVPAIAFSTGSHEVPWREWKEAVLLPDALPMWERVSGVAARLAAELARVLVRGEVLNVGVPDTANGSTRRRLTTVARVGYDRLFAEIDPGVYTHAYGGLIGLDNDLSGTDVEAAADGVISVTAIQGAGGAPASRALVDLLGA